MYQWLVCGLLFFSAISLVGCFDLAATQSMAKDKEYVFKSKAQVFVMRGGLGGIFSTGMNQLQHTLEKEYRIKTESTVWYKAHTLSHYIIKHYGTDTLPGPIILVGHSLGGNDQIKVAQSLYKAHIPVALLLTVDAVSPLEVPPNVREVVNIYKPSFVPMFSGLLINPLDNKATRVQNINVNTIPQLNVNHFTIEKNPNIQQLMLNKVLEVIHRDEKPLKIPKTP